MSPWDADVPPLFSTGQRCPHRLYHSSIQLACRELWHLPCRLADGERGSLWGQESLSCVGQLVTPLLSSEQANCWADCARHHHHHGSRGRAGMPGGLQAGVGVPGPQLLPQQQRQPVCLPAAPFPALTSPHLLGRILFPGEVQVGDIRGQWHLLWDNVRGTQGKGGGHAARTALAIALQKWIWVLQWVGNAAGQGGTSSFPWLPPSTERLSCLPRIGPSCGALGCPWG